MPEKTHQTAMVVIPPPSCWEPIQAIRRQHDRQLRRWMPHVTLVYPFRPRAQLAAVADQLRAVCTGIEPVELRLGEFRHFEHGPESYTLWLAPEPADDLIRLEAALESVVPDCNDTSRYPDGFTPHLSVGQVRGREALTNLEHELQEQWRTLSFVVTEISLIWRAPAPDDVFRIDRGVPLGR